MEPKIDILITNRTGEIVSRDNIYRSYNFDTQYGAIASAFSVSLADLDADIQTGYGIQFLINNRIYFQGIIQRRQKVIDKGNRGIIISGKDRSSILVESYCNNYKDFNNESPKDIIDSLINQTNFYTKQKGTIEESEDTSGFNNSDDIDTRNEVVLSDVNESDTVSGREDTTYYDDEFLLLGNKKHFKINIGDTVYGKISEVVEASGYEILYLENGTLYIGDLNKKRYADTVVYDITQKKDGIGNNVLRASFSEDDSGRYSTISISSQSEEYSYDSGAHVNKETIATDSTLRGKKFYANHINSDENDPEKIAIQIREDQRREGYQLIYEVPGHIAKNGEVWAVNRYAKVTDEILEIYRHLVIYGRTFIFDDRRGRQTILRLSHERLNELEI